MYLRLKELREDNNLLQKNIADYLNITQQQYSLYESMERLIPINKIDKLAEFYKTSIDYLVGLTDEKKPYPRKKNNP